MLGNAEPRGPQYMNVNWIGPALLGFGTEEQKARFLPPMAAGTVRWCQGFSETEAGLDPNDLPTGPARARAGLPAHRGQSSCWMRRAGDPAAVPGQDEPGVRSAP